MDKTSAPVVTGPFQHAFSSSWSEIEMPQVGTRAYNKPGHDPLANAPYSRKEWPDKDKGGHPIWVNYEVWNTTHRPPSIRTFWLNALERAVSYLMCFEGPAGSAPKSLLRAGSDYNLICDTLTQLWKGL